ncbi:MAG: hypothetical protein SFW62_02790 [Alphaproteobacteria bacterium]|nr:hypothetical protein [Alphaproteobacteria bacterium]
MSNITMILQALDLPPGLVAKLESNRDVSALLAEYVTAKQALLATGMTAEEMTSLDTAVNGHNPHRREQIVLTLRLSALGAT